MRALTRTCIVAVFSGLLVMTAASETSTAFQPSARINAVITFVQPSTASKLSDVSLGYLGGNHFEEISLSTDGTLHAKGKNGDRTGTGQPSVIQITNTKDSIVNFVPTNYRPGGKISTMQANCALQSAGGQSCMEQPVGGGARTLYIGMDMTVADDVGYEQGKTQKQPSFDMSIVYQ